MLNPVVFSRKSDNWKTPVLLYQKLDKEFQFDFDPCPLAPDFDGLVIDWKQSNFINPPYSQIAKWIEKGYNEWKKEKTVVFLIPSRTDTKWFHQYILPFAEIRFFKGRLRFDGGKYPAPFPSMVVIFYKGKAIPPSTKVQGILA